jgi:hypothetical protein
MRLSNLNFIGHSIAFKPAESGWGANSQYTNNFDNIFGKNNNSQTRSVHVDEKQKEEDGEKDSKEKDGKDRKDS